MDAPQSPDNSESSAAVEAPSMMLRLWERYLPLCLFAAIFITAAWVRFDGVTRQGVMRGDSFKYLREARIWADGREPEFMIGRFYRPAVYFLQGWAIRIGGDNDYSIKVMHGVLDLFSLTMLTLIASLLCRSYWAGLAAPLLYALNPQIVYYVRTETAHAISTFFVLLALLLFVLFERTAVADAQRRRLNWLFLFMSGVCSALAANSHPDLAALAGGYVLYLVIGNFLNPTPTGRMKLTIQQVGLFGLGFICPYAMALPLLGSEALTNVAVIELLAGTRGGRKSGVDFSVLMTRPLETFRWFRGSLHSFLGPGAHIRVAAFSVPFVMAWLAWRRSEKWGSAHLPLLLIGVYFIAYGLLANNFITRLYRVLIPIFPLILLMITVWPYKLAQCHLRRGHNLLYLAIFTLMFYTGPKRFYVRRSPYRVVYEILKDKVDENNKVLIAPAVAYRSDRAWRSRYYFRANAVYQINLPIVEEYSVDYLEELLSERSISYILIVNRIDRRYLANLRNIGGWRGSEDSPYTVFKDRKNLLEYVRRHEGHLVRKRSWGELYWVDQTPSRHWSEHANLIANGSFEQWSNEGPDRWRVSGKSVLELSDVTDGAQAAIMPIPRASAKQGTRLVHRLKIPEGVRGSRLYVAMDAKAAPGSLSYAVYAPVNGRMEAITSPRRPGISDWRNYDGDGDWRRLLCDVEIPDQTDRRKMNLIIMLRPGASQPALIDDVSAYIYP